MRPRRASGLGPPLPKRAPGRHRGPRSLRRAAVCGVLFSLVLFLGPLIAVITYAT